MNFSPCEQSLDMFGVKRNEDGTLLRSENSGQVAGVSRGTAYNLTQC
jgi:hypothetical protein